MTSRDRMLACIRGDKPDHVPLYCWVFGFRAPEHLRWVRDGRQVEYWYTCRMEHIHTIAEPWDVEQDFRRVDAWLSLGLDDVLDVSVPWGWSERVSYKDFCLPAGTDGSAFPVLVREYNTPEGDLRHAVRRTQELQALGWVVQPDHVPLFEDMNIPRAVHHLVSSAADVAKVRWVLSGPSAAQEQSFAARMQKVKRFADDRGVMVQAWSAFGMDAVVWMAGVEGAITLCLDQPDSFDELMGIVHASDRARSALALEQGADVIVQRGWYSSTDFWSPAIFRRYLKPRIAELAAMVHARGKLFAYVMTTGVMKLGPELVEAGVDLLYYVDPVQDHVDLRQARKLFGDRMAVAGGVNSSVTLARGTKEDVRSAVRGALEVFSREDRFILSPVDALFPDTPWENVETMIAAWRRFGRV